MSGIDAFLGERVFSKPPSGLPPLVVETSDGMHRDGRHGVLIVHRFRLHVTEDEDGKQWFSYREAR